MRWTKLMMVAVLMAGSLAVAGDVLAQEGTDIETFFCESRDGRHNECRYQATGVVTVHVKKQLSNARCVFNENWGTFDGGVWVDYGCRAEFVVRRPPNTASYRPVGGGMQTVTCESRDNRYQMCQVSNIDPSSVTLERRHSGAECIRGSSWGVSEGENSPPGIWVSNGCRATFAYTVWQSTYQPYAGTSYDHTVTCISEMGEWRHCEVPQIYMARVEIVSGNEQCQGYKAWGTDDTGIWVRSDCKGDFRVMYRH